MATTLCHLLVRFQLAPDGLRVIRVEFKYGDTLKFAGRPRWSQGLKALVRFVLHQVAHGRENPSAPQPPFPTDHGPDAKRIANAMYAGLDDNWIHKMFGTEVSNGNQVPIVYSLIDWDEPVHYRKVDRAPLHARLNTKNLPVEQVVIQLRHGEESKQIRIQSPKALRLLEQAIGTETLVDIQKIHNAERRFKRSQSSGLKGEDDRPTVSITTGEVEHIEASTKMLVRTPQVSECLITLKDVSSVLDIVLNSQVATFHRDEDKDQPKCEELPYNHIVQPSVAIGFVVGEEEPVYLKYMRGPSGKSPRHTNTRGWALLWGLPLLYGVKTNASSCVKSWVSATQHDPAAATEAWLGPRPWLLTNLLKQDFNINGEQFTAEPLGIITNDMRQAEPRRNRIYTHIVFRLLIQLDALLPPRDLAYRFLKRTMSIDLLGSPPASGEDLFQNFDGRPNPMDVLAWDAIFKKQTRSEFRTARWTRELKLV
ncbi:MAG: hypothetical protein WD534_15175 [Phycisphaeraceae bacterium]